MKSKLTKQGVRDLNQPSNKECPYCFKQNMSQSHRKIDGECYKRYSEYVAAKIAGELDR